jgi:hypothetical protein
MIDTFLGFFVVTLIPIAIPSTIGPGAERVLFGGWRVLQLATLAVALLITLRRLVLGRWVDRLLALAVALALGYVALSCVYVEFDAQIEYQRVLLLADRYHGLWHGYRHGFSRWILGYPPGTSLSVIWYRWLHLPTANLAQDVLLFLWFANFITRHLRNLDAAGKTLFSVLLFSAPLVQWHATFFYNNLFYALLWAQLVLLPLFDATPPPRERCATALVLVWMRPQWQLAAIPILSSALTMIGVMPALDWRRVRDLALTTLAMLLVAWLGAIYWQRMIVRLSAMQQTEQSAIEHAIEASQDPHTLELAIESTPVKRRLFTPEPLLSRRSAGAVRWAWDVTMHSYAVSMTFLGAAALLALVLLRRRALPFLVPLLSPLGIIVGTAMFARTYGDYSANAWALERLQIICPILAAGVAAALHHHLRAPGSANSDSKSTRGNTSRNPPTPAL